jgi:hypothetical protein
MKQPKEFRDYQKDNVTPKVTPDFKTLERLLKDRSMSYISDDGHYASVSDTIAYSLYYTMMSKKKALETTNNGSHYMILKAEIEMLERLISGTVIDI